MRLSLEAATDVATYIIFDPSALSADAVNPRKPFETVDAITARGEAICYSDCSDGQMRFLILVDEPPDAEMVARRRHKVENALLRVPSGRLVATGFEDLWGRGRHRYSPEHFTARMGAVAIIPAGDYAVDAFEVDWGDEPEEEVAARARPGDEQTAGTIGMTLGCSCLATILALPVVWVQAGIETALHVTAWAGTIWWLLFLVLKYSGAWNRMAALRKEVYAKYPGAVLVLRRLPPGAAGGSFRPGKFGENYADPSRNE